MNHGPNSVKKRVVYLHHGLLMNSEVWVCLTDEQRSLSFTLVERGFDVWVSLPLPNTLYKKVAKTDLELPIAWKQPG